MSDLGNRISLARIKGARVLQPVLGPRMKRNEKVRSPFREQYQETSEKASTVPWRAAIRLRLVPFATVSHL